MSDLGSANAGDGRTSTPTRIDRDGNTIPIIFITAHNEEKKQAQAIQAGAVRFRRKPFNEKDLIDGIRLPLKCSEYGPKSPSSPKK